MPLPRPDWLSLPQTVAFVVKATGERAADVRSALIDAALAGAIIATGCLHASAVPGESEYFAARLNPRTDVRPEAWGDEICWQISRVGLYSLVRFELAEIERWLSAAAPGPHARAILDAPEPPPDRIAAETAESNAAHARIQELPRGTPPKQKRRLAYKGELVGFMRRLKREALAALSDDDVAQRFADYIEVRVRAGKSALMLPQHRHVANQVAQLRAEIHERQ